MFPSLGLLRWPDRRGWPVCQHLRGKADLTSFIGPVDCFDFQSQNFGGTISILGIVQKIVITHDDVETTEVEKLASQVVLRRFLKGVVQPLEI